MSQPTTDRNLLFGILALQLDFISRDALVKAMNAWVLEKSKSLGQILLEQQALGSDEHELLAALVQKHLHKHGNDAEQSLAAVSSVGSVREELRQIADPDLQASLVHVSKARQTEGDEWATGNGSVGTPTSSGLRFRVLRPHARGGLGQVSVAQDEELHREVALKEIQERHADDPDSRARFLLEAEITGGLEHPGIVPVYGLGVYADGRPYYAMRFIRGDSLKGAIERFHQAEGPKRDPGERSLRLRELLGRFVDVCNAMAYAHSRGVLHRDLKPGNIMLGQYGETLVVDWGLAKPVERPELASSQEGRLVPSSASDSARTQIGAAVGTPEFMSPEQAAGRLDQLGPATDVYSLGATLYCLLTGTSAFPRGEEGDVLHLVQQGHFAPPRQVKKNVPVALEAVCRKAMALQPQERYSSVRALAEDIEHFLADEPVTAYRERWAERAGRWMRRNRTKVTAAMVALVVLVVTLTLATVLLTAANERERTAKNKARDRFKQAREAVDTFYTEVSESTEMKAQGVEKLRAKLLKSATEYYERFIQEEEGKEPEVQAERARACHRLGKLDHEIGRNAEAETCHEEASRIWKALVAQYPERVDYQDGLADALFNLSRLYSDTGRNDLAEKTYLEALTIRKKLATDHPEVTIYREKLGNSLNNLSSLYRDTGRNDLAEKTYQEALSIRGKLAADYPDISNYQSKLVNTYLDLGMVYRLSECLEKAAEMEQAALAVSKRLLAASPKVLAYQKDLGRCYHNLGLTYTDMERYDLAEQAFLEALHLRKPLAETNPKEPWSRRNVAWSYRNLGHVYNKTGRQAAALKAYQESLALARALTAAHPDETDYATILGSDYVGLGNVERDTGQPAAALKWYGEARQTLAAVLQKNAQDPDARKFQRKAYAGRAAALTLLGRPTEALADWDRALDFASGSARDSLRVSRALTLARSGDHSRAAVEADELARGKSLSGAVLCDLARIASLASAAVRTDVKLTEPERTTHSQENAARAVALLERARDVGYFKEAAHVARLQQDTDFEALRAQAAFKKLLTELEGQARTPKP